MTEKMKKYDIFFSQNENASPKLHDDINIS